MKHILIFFGLVLASAQFIGCATLLDGDDRSPASAYNPAEYDRDYQASERDDASDESAAQKCSGRFCASSTEDPEQAGVRSGMGTGYEVHRTSRAIRSRDVVLGMTRSQVLQSWGEPNMREVAGNGREGHERWRYGSRLSLTGERIVIFENGRVAGWYR